MASKKGDDVFFIVEERLCTSCGACSAVCPVAAISFEETVEGLVHPNIDSKKCTNCGLCLSVCPGIHFGKTLKHSMPSDPFQGECLASYVGKATDKDLFDNSQSGGVASAIMLYMLENGMVDAAITVVMDWGNPPRPKVVLAKHRSDIVKAQKSKYCPVPALEILRELDGQDIEKVVLVGTSCQIHGLKNMLDVAPHIGNKVVLTIGLFCAGVMSCAAIDHFMYVSQIGKMDNPADKNIVYRDKFHTGYPGHVRLTDKEGSSEVIDIKVRARIRNYYLPMCCNLCFDRLNIFSDIAVGDPWRIDIADMDKGENVIVVRTKKGQEVFNKLKEEKIVAVREVPFPMVVKGQKIPQKICDWNGFTRAWKKMGHTPPDYGDRVYRYAEGPADEEKYTKDIEASISFKKYETREELIQDVERDSLLAATPPKTPLPKRLLRYGRRKISKLLKG